MWVLYTILVIILILGIGRVIIKRPNGLGNFLLEVLCITALGEILEALFNDDNITFD